MIAQMIEFYLAQIKRVWKHLPESLRQSRFGIRVGRHIHALVQKHADRKQYFGTFFLRNRAELQTLCGLVEGRQANATVSLAVIACSKGAEVYTFVWALRRQFPKIDLRVCAVDISADILEFARHGAYSLRSQGAAIESTPSSSSEVREISFHTSVDQSAPIFERVSSEELDSLAELRDGVAYVREDFKQGIQWVHGDALAPDLLRQIGQQDYVIANRFLCHMAPAEAERCLKNVAHLVKPNGFIFVTGVDLEVRTKVARELSWKPVTENMRETHEGDCSLRRGWPLEYWGVEPFGAVEEHEGLRYVSIFQIPAQDCSATSDSSIAAVGGPEESEQEVLEERTA